MFSGCIADSISATLGLSFNDFADCHHSCSECLGAESVQTQNLCLSCSKPERIYVEHTL